MKIGFVSLGCSKNLVDSEKMMGMLRSGKHELVSNPKEAQAIIINTCGFIQSAKEEAIETIFEMAKYKQEGQCEKLIVVGCLAQRYKEELERDIPEVDLFVSIKEYGMLNELLANELDGEALTSYSKSERLISSKPWTAYLKIAEGCSNRCTYCAIPLIRGGNVSFPMEQLIEEARELATSGVKELVLIAQDTTKYGIDLYDELSLYKLLEELHKIEGFHWIRILYMYPDEIDDRLIETMSRLPKVLPYFDIPMQHASDRLLEAMNRRGTNADVRSLANTIRKTFDNPTLRTTFIVGFPTEEDEDINILLDFMDDIEWDRMGAFTYSPEDDTVANNWEQTVSEEEKQKRFEKIMELQSSISLRKQEEMIGRTIEVLVESKEGLTGMYRGRDASSAPDGVDGIVRFSSSEELQLGSFVNVEVTSAKNYDLIGEYKNTVVA